MSAFVLMVLIYLPLLCTYAYICMYGYFSWTDFYTSSFDYPVVLIDRRESECNNSSWIPPNSH